MAAYPVSKTRRETNNNNNNQKKKPTEPGEESRVSPLWLVRACVCGGCWEALAAPGTLRGWWDAPSLLQDREYAGMRWVSSTTVLLLKLLPSLILSLLTSGRCRTNQLRAVPVAIKQPHQNPARALRAIYATHSRRQLSRICLQTVMC